MSNYRKTLSAIALLLLGILACKGPSKPTVEILAPVNGSRVQLGEHLDVEYRATDALAIVRVELEVDGQIVDFENSPEPEGQPSMSGLLRWTPSTPGVHALMVYAHNRNGIVSDQVAIEIIVEEGAGAESTVTIPLTRTTPTPLTHRGVPTVTTYPGTPTVTIGAPVPSPSPTPSQVNLSLINNSGVEVCDVRISAPGAPWGENWLVGDTRLAPGESMTWSISPGQYQLWARDCNGETLSITMLQAIQASWEWVISPPPTPPPLPPRPPGPPRPTPTW